MKQHLLKKIPLASLIALFVALPAAHAATLTIYSAATFSADTSGDVAGNFSSVPVPPGGFAGFNPLQGYPSLNGVSISTANAGGKVNVNSGGLYGANDLQMSYAVNSTYSGNGDDIFTITLPHAETAFGLDLGSLFNSTTDKITLSGQVPVNFTTPTAQYATGFIGFVSSTPFSNIEIDAPNSQSIVIADFTQGTADPADLATPLPPSWSMMLLALLALAWVSFASKRNGKSQSSRSL